MKIHVPPWYNVGGRGDTMVPKKSEAQKRANRKWDRENLIKLCCITRKEDAARYKADCAERGTNVNADLLQHVRDRLAAYDARHAADGPADGQQPKSTD